MSEIVDAQIAADLAKLPPGPWHSEGSNIFAGTVLVASVQVTTYRTFPHAAELARILCKLPDWLHILKVANPDVMQARIEELENEVEELEKLLEEKVD